jgi:exopolyphosphatase/guanosine-5'-triphosphate,3'-diphosphate pyrophosphatase
VAPEPEAVAEAVAVAVAAIDCGTNSTRLLVADRSGKELLRLMRITRLGQGVDRTNALAPEAISRTIGVLREFRRSMDDLGVGRVRMVATSAVRDAENGAAFTEAAREAVGSAPEVLSGLEEGTLAYRGASADLDPFDGDTLVVDIGGGSTEITLGRGGPVASVSLQLGCVRLTERFLTSDPPTPDEIAATHRAIADALAWGEQQMPELRDLASRRRLVGLAGTVSTLASLHLGLAEYDPQRLHHARLPVRELTGLCANLAMQSAAERGGLVGMTPGRQDVIVGGALVLLDVAARYQCPEVIVSEKDILDGIVLSIL